jgi:hypothetical protein
VILLLHSYNLAEERTLGDCSALQTEELMSRKWSNTEYKNRSSSAEIQGIKKAAFILVSAMLVTIAGSAQTLAIRPYVAKSDEPASQSQTATDTMSLRNALAQPADEYSTFSAGNRTKVQFFGSDFRSSEINRLVVEMTERMPVGGEYRASSESIGRLESAIKAMGDHLVIDAAVAEPSFCSSATYLVFVSTLEELNRQRKIQFEPGVAQQLIVSGQRDGDGVWGRWNANGPGTARLFAELRIGRNFTSIEQAQPGDFLKIFWNDQIGAREFGHSVVFLGRWNRDGTEVVEYWSSNKKGGYGRAEVPLWKIKRMLFSRLESPERINQIGAGLKPDRYLAAMLTRSSTPREMEEMVGIFGTRTPGPPAIPQQ